MGVVIQLIDTLQVIVETLMPESEKFFPAIFSATYTLVNHTSLAVQSRTLNLVAVSNCAVVFLVRFHWWVPSLAESCVVRADVSVAHHRRNCGGHDDHCGGATHCAAVQRRGCSRRFHCTSPESVKHGTSGFLLISLCLQLDVRCCVVCVSSTET